MIYHGIPRNRAAEFATAASIFVLTWLAGSLGWLLGGWIATDVDVVDVEEIVVCACVREDDRLDAE